MKRRNDPWDKPWVTIAAVVGIIAVVVIAIIFFMGSGSTGGQATPVQSAPAQTTQAPSGSPSQSVTASGTVNPVSIKELPTVTIPVEGAYVKVSYIGSFAGTYGINEEILTVRDSGERIFPLNGTTGSVSATFRKEDSSTRHEIVVEIYKNGKVLKSAKNTSAYGEVSVNYPV